MDKLIRRQVAHKLSGVSPLLNRLYVGRGVVDPSDLDNSMAGLLPPGSFKGMSDSVSLLQEAVTGQQRILIVGDFDADGATSSALMVSCLKAFGARHVDYLVPDRFKFGYGLTPEIVAVAADFSPDLIVTVDNGMSSIEGVQAAVDSNMKVVITDHHLAGDILPAAHAILNPNQPGCEFPSKALAGVGVAFYLLSALRSSLREIGWFQQAEPNLADCLDLVALGTIADVVSMDKNNRILVSEGLRRIRAGRARPGIYALISVSGADYKQLTSRDLAFGIGPRLNAAGRLENMSLGIECLLADGNRAVELADHLEALNNERKSIETEMKVQAQETIVKHQDVGQNEFDVGVCLFHPEWHQGVVGIIASRIKDQIHRPVIAFAQTSDSELKGSARSIPGLHIRDALDTIAARNPGVLVKFGGHAMAAGLSIEPGNFEKFQQLFNQEAKRWLSEEDLERVIVSDGEVGETISKSLALHVIEAAPWGSGFPEPVFDGEFEVLDQRIVASRHLKLKLRPLDEDEVIEAIAFNHDRLIEQRQLRLAYRLDINRFRGRESVQLIVESVAVTLDT
ncbi:MAG: single-stranded-DNA-specific exonuclease RecJ [Gammaproteobacteria bacterium]|nr:single-stranded-DNA-specific exonuclease RecJ [Gammaproteobacteria bacterium]